MDIEKVKIWFCHLLPVGKCNGLSTGNIGYSQFIINLYDHFIICIITNHLCHIRAKRKKTAFRRFSSIRGAVAPSLTHSCAAEFTLSAAAIMPSLALSYVRPPCMNAVYGARIGPSADSSIDAPPTKAPAAMMTGSA